VAAAQDRQQTVPIALQPDRLSRGPGVRDSPVHRRETTRSRAPPHFRPDDWRYRRRFQARQGSRTIHTGARKMIGGGAAVHLGRDLQRPQHARHGDGRGTHGGSTCEGGGWGLKAIAIYRDGSKRYQPLNTRWPTRRTPDTINVGGIGGAQRAGPRLRSQDADERRGDQPQVRHQAPRGLYIRSASTRDGTPRRDLLVMSKEGSTISGDGCLRDQISLALQLRRCRWKWGEEVRATRFEASGFTRTPNSIAEVITIHVLAGVAVLSGTAGRPSEFYRREPIVRLRRRQLPSGVRWKPGNRPIEPAQDQFRGPGGRAACGGTAVDHDSQRHLLKCRNAAARRVLLAKKAEEDTGSSSSDPLNHVNRHVVVA